MLDLITPLKTDASSYRFIDLFAGIGGFHFALASLGATCVFASEKDPFARLTYIKNHPIAPEHFNDDIRNIATISIPDHDVLCAGFPCQPFSQAGQKKGFSDGDDSERGNLFFCILDILEEKRPKAFILENVRHLLKHDEGKTFSTILEHLTALNYDVSYQVLKASDFGIPQHRPRVFIVGFDKAAVNTTRRFCFPTPIPLTLTMSDVWEGDCDKEIGFTLRVGGKGSDITDRRNWDSYRVDGEVKRIGVKQAKRMMGLPEAFEFPVSKAQSMKQLGNSVCVPVVQHVAAQVFEYLTHNTKDVFMPTQTLNKGEWSELIPLLSFIVDNRLHFGSPTATPQEEYVTVFNVAYNPSRLDYQLENTEVELRYPNGDSKKLGTLSGLISKEQLKTIIAFIASSRATFEMHSFQELLNTLEITTFKGDNQHKGDMKVSFEHAGTAYEHQPLGVKSHLGGLPTLLNASSATNFVFEILDFQGDSDSINAIQTSSKVRDRLVALEQQGASLRFSHCENKTHEENLRKVDSLMPELLAECLLAYYKGKGTRFTDFLLNDQQLCRVKDYLKAILLGMFSSRVWDGNYTATGFLLILKEGDLLLYHVIKDFILKDYLLNHTKLDTPSTTRHRFATVYKEKNGRYYIKLNLQVRLTK